MTLPVSADAVDRHLVASLLCASATPRHGAPPVPSYLARAQRPPWELLLRALHPENFRDFRAFIAATGGAPRVASFAATDLASVARWVDSNRDQDIFVGVAERTTAAGRNLEFCANLHALFADIDFKDSSEAEARARLGAFPLAPSIVVATGGGLHVYYLLSAPLDLRSDDGRRTAGGILRALALRLGGDLKSAEPARILRLPGTFNHKYSPPRDVVVEVMELGRRYTPSDLARCVVAQDGSAAGAGGSPPGEPLPQTIADGSRNNTLFREGCRLRRLGFDGPEIVAALLAVNGRRCHPPLMEREVRIIAAGCEKYAPSPDTFPLTESGDAAFFATQYAETVKFDHNRNVWLVLDEPSGIWLRDRDGQVMRLAIETMRERQRLALKISEPDQRKSAAGWALKGESRARLTNMLELARNLEPITDAGDNWDRVPHLLGTPTGVVDLRSGEVRRADPAERISMRTTVPLDPAASSPLWDRAVTDIFPDPQEQEYTQTALGYSTTGETNLDKWFLGFGREGRNGKGTLFGAVQAALGDYAIELDAATFDRRKDSTPFNLAKLPGKRFVHCAEAGDSTTLHHDRIKQLSGGDTLMAGDKHQRAFKFEPCGKLWFTCNTKPKVSDQSKAFWARVVVVEFSQTFHGREDIGLRDALRRDSSHQRAVLRWLVDGARRYYAERGLGLVPKAFQAATAEFQLESDVLAEFYADCCDIGWTGKERERARDLWSAYQMWSVEMNIKHTLGSKNFYQQLATRFKRKEEGRGSWYLGVTLKAKYQVGEGPDPQEVISGIVLPD